MMGVVRAPDFDQPGLAWFNVAAPLSLAALRGKLVILDFWTFCCINCLHVLDELRALEEKYADVLVIVGVHSPKFEHEKDAAALEDELDRLERNFGGMAAMKKLCTERFEQFGTAGNAEKLKPLPPFCGLLNK